MKREVRGSPSSEHEAVYHAAPRCQAASLSLTSRRLHGQKKACSVEGKNTGGFASGRQTFLRRFGSVALPGGFKGRRLIGSVGLEHGKGDPRPNIGEGTHCDTVTFALCPFAVVIGFCPALLLRTLPGELVQGIAQRFDTAQASVRLRVVSAGKQDRRSASKRLQAGCVRIAMGIIANFCQQSRSQAFSCPRQTAEDLVVFMTQKKAFDLLI